jgi:hypothetical protein
MLRSATPAPSAARVICETPATSHRTGVHALAYRQAGAPERLLGRITAGYRFISYGAIPIGALLGGLAGKWLGPRISLVLGTVGLLTAAVFVLLSPLRHVRELPRSPEIAEPGGA